jgi:predicted ribosome quality control (RQC) complex YloA/Tae2 family protein
MSIDTFTTTALVDEFKEKLVGGRVQDTVELDRQSFGFEIYANHQRQYLLLAAHTQSPRAMISPDKLRRGVPNPSQLGLLLRTRVEGLFLDDVRQPPWERILIFDFVGPDDLRLQLVLELIDRRANLVLVEDGVILDCARRIGPDENRVRVILPKREYEPPPPIPGERIHPEKISPHTLATILNRSPKQKAWLAIVKGIEGVSPPMAKEALYRARSDTNTSAKDANPYGIDAAFRSFLPQVLKHHWRPGVAFDENGLAQALGVYPITHLGEWRDTQTVSEAIALYYGSLEGSAAYEAARKPIRQQIEKARDKLRGKLVSLERSMRDDSEVEYLRKAGELLLAYQYGIEAGQTELEAQYDVEGDPIKVKIDPDLSPVENAQKYFAKYEKAKRARQQVPKRLAATQHEMAYLDQLEADLDNAENWQDIGEVQETLQQGGYWQGKKYSYPKGSRSGPHRVNRDDGFTILVGRNARQNEEVTFNRGDPYDLWLHARNVPGAHVVIKTQARDVPPEVLEEAASYAAFYSKMRNERKVDVMVAECRHVRKIKGGHPGQVRVFQERGTVLAQPRPVEA